MVLESEEKYEKEGLIEVSRQVQAGARNWLRQRHGIQAGLMRFVTLTPNNNDNFAIVHFLVSTA